jgi:hypothetical protein
MEKKQTAVEWFIEQLKNEGVQYIRMSEQAKKMEKQQILIAYDMGDRDVRYQPEKYYEQTYGGNE